MSPILRMAAPVIARTTPAIWPGVITWCRKIELISTCKHGFMLKIEIATPAIPVEIAKFNITRAENANMPAVPIMPIDIGDSSQSPPPYTVVTIRHTVPIVPSTKRKNIPVTSPST
jgi:hypothetical protein